MLSQVIGGFSPAPRNQIETFTIRYTGGVTIDYEGEAAELIMQEILRATFFASQMEFLQMQQAKAAEEEDDEETTNGPAFHGKSFRDYIQQQESQIKPPKES
jgi:hypothetical protein